METPAEDQHVPTNGTADASTEPVPAEENRGAEVSAPTGPSGLRLAVTSIAAFLGIVAIGGGIGLLSGAGVSDADAMSAVALIEPEVQAAVEVAPEPAPTTAAPTTVPPTTVAPTSVAPTTTTAPTTTAPETESAISVTADDVTVSEPVVVVRGVTELALPLADAADAQAETPTTGPDPTDVDFLELPKAVYDRFTLRTGDSFAINIAANDKIGGVFQSVELTGLGELAPGFYLNADGTLSGAATECGVWKAQYALNSTNPAVGTSWIDITVSGCANT